MSTYRATLYNTVGTIPVGTLDDADDEGGISHRANPLSRNGRRKPHLRQDANITHLNASRHLLNPMVDALRSRA